MAFCTCGVMPCFGSENNAVVCPVVLLDETEMTVEIKVSCLARAKACF